MTTFTIHPDHSVTDDSGQVVGFLSTDPEGNAIVDFDMDVPLPLKATFSMFGPEWARHFQ